MDKYIRDENLKIFRNHLAKATDEKQRQMLRDLIAETQNQTRLLPLHDDNSSSTGGTHDDPSLEPRDLPTRELKEHGSVRQTPDILVR